MCSPESHERDSETIRSGFGAQIKPGGGGPDQSNVRDVETLIKELCAPAFFDSQKNSHELQEKSDSLMQRIKVETSSFYLTVSL